VTVETEINGGKVTATCETAYPFRNTVQYTVTNESDTPIAFTYRIPAWSVETYVNGSAVDVHGFQTVEVPAHGIVKLDITFKANVCVEQRPYKLSAVSYGPLVFSLPIKSRWEKREYEKNGVPRTYPYCDYDIYPESEWNFAFDGADFEVIENELTDTPFSEENPPLQIRTNFRRIHWGLERGYLDVCAKVPKSRVPYGETETILMQPYGCTTLRMTEMPQLKK
ncbi:MAG: glycoside hydrolase family 127 protein, partial [Clostridia bacterium]|nr:glycoside hydrolase family 127 protein [Clostridia bacterium]